MCLCVGDEYFNIYIVIANIQSDIPAGALSTAVEYQMMQGAVVESSSSQILRCYLLQYRAQQQNVKFYFAVTMISI